MDLPSWSVSVGSGYRVEFDPAANVDVYIEGLTPNHPIPRVMRNCLRPGDCMLDIGANVGYLSLMAASIVGDTGQVYAFEPSPEVLPNLRRNLATNPRAPIQLLPVAVADRVGTVTFHVPSGHRSALSSMRTLWPGARSIEVEAITLDSLLNSLPHIHFAKIDVEGAELLVLRGMQQLIARDRPLILMEFSDHWLRELGGSGDALLEELKTRGYRVYDLFDMEHELTQPPAAQTDVLCVPE